MNNETKHTPEVLEAAQKLLKQVVYAHTPGPWGIIKETQPGQMERLFVGHIGLTVAEIPLGLYNTEANARLIASAPDMAKEIAQLKQQNEELKAHEQEIRDCWTEERTDHNKAREEIAQLRADKVELTYVCVMALEVIKRHDNCQTGCRTTNDSALYGYTGEDNLTDNEGIKSIGDRLHDLIAKHTKV